MAEFAKLAPTDTPTYLSRDVDDKIDLLRRETNYLIGKAQRFVPKPKTTTTTAKTPSTNETKSDDDESATKATTVDPIPDNEGEETEPKTDAPNEGQSLRRCSPRSTAFRLDDHPEL